MASLGVPRRFRIIRQLGEGGMGVVYEAFDDERGTHVALKTIRNVTADAIGRFKREFRALQDVQHPNLVTLGELVAESDAWFFTMELVEGRDFLSHVRHSAPHHPYATTMTPSQSRPRAIATAPTLEISPRSYVGAPSDADGVGIGTGAADGTYDEARLRDALRQLARGLSALHAAGLVHRDVKPSNVHVTREGRVVILDFGLVTQMDHWRYASDMSDMATAGTAAYMAPEQAMGKPVGAEADWYAVGVLLYEALLGRLPFEGAPLDVIAQKLRDERPPPRSVDPRIPADLDALCVALLRIDPSRRPTPEQIALVLDDAEGARAATRLHPSQAQRRPFVGRRGELEALRAAYEQTRAGRAAAVLVQGESGVGKTALVRHFADGVLEGDPDTVILAGRCYEREAVPFKAFDAALDALARYVMHLSDAEAARIVPTRPGPLLQVFPALKRVAHLAAATRASMPVMDPLELRSRAFAALRNMLARLAEGRQLIVIIDDLQWADADSMTMLSELLRPPEAPPLLLLATWRKVRGDQGATEKRLDALPGQVTRVVVQSLGADEARDLARTLLELAGRGGDLREGEAEGIAREAAGHPLFIDELVRFASNDGDTSAGADARDRAAPAPVHLDAALWHRIAPLEAPALRLLQVVSVAGAPLDSATAALAVGVPIGELRSRVALLRGANLVRTAGLAISDTIEPFHDRVRDTVSAHLSPESRVTLHRDLARALEASGNAPPDALTLHFREAGEVDAAAQYAVKAGAHAAASLAFDQAAEFYRIALAGSLRADEKLDILAKLGRALMNAGRCAEAADVYQEVAASTQDEAQRLEFRRLAAEQLLVAGHLDRGLEEIHGVLAEMNVRLPITPLGALLSLLWNRFVLRLRGFGWTSKSVSAISPRELQRLEIHRALAMNLAMVDHVRGAEFQARGLLLALRTGEPIHIAQSLALEANYQASEGSGNEARVQELLGEANRIAAASADPYLRAYTKAAEGNGHYLAGRGLEAAKHLREAESLFREGTSGKNWEMNGTRTFLMYSLRLGGALRELGERLDAYLVDAARRGDHFADITLARAFNLVWLARDEPARARHELERRTWGAPKHGFLHLQQWYELRANLEVELYEAKVEGTRARWAKLASALEGSLLVRVQTVRTESRWLQGRLALAEADAGLDAVRAVHDARRFAARLERDDVGYAQVWARLLRAGIAVQEGDGGRAAALLREAMELGDRHDVRAAAAVARHRLAALAPEPEARALRETSDAWMRDEGVKNPARLAALLAPGFARQRPRLGT